MKNYDICVVREESREKTIYQPKFFSKLILKNQTTEAKIALLSPCVLVLKSHTQPQCN